MIIGGDGYCGWATALHLSGARGRGGAGGYPAVPEQLHRRGGGRPVDRRRPAHLPPPSPPPLRPCHSCCAPSLRAARGYEVCIVDNLVRRSYDLQVGGWGKSANHFSCIFVVCGCGACAAPTTCSWVLPRGNCRGRRRRSSLLVSPRPPLNQLTSLTPLPPSQPNQQLGLDTLTPIASAHERVRK